MEIMNILYIQMAFICQLHWLFKKQNEPSFRNRSFAVQSWL